MILQPVNDIAAICARCGVREAILSPGSRSAPLTLAFARHPDIRTRVVADERAAAFIALGIAQTSKTPVALVCTSGSAAYNYAPAVAEAFFNHIPLLVFTADRPPEWIDQLDGQTIRQSGIYGRHIKASYDFPVSTDHPDAAWHAGRMVAEAVQTSGAFPKGPVHVNVPVREPFYPESGENYGYSEKLPAATLSEGTKVLSPHQKEWLAEEWSRYSRILIVAGQGEEPAPALLEALTALHEGRHITIMGDVLSNLHALPFVIRRQDTFLGHLTDEEKERLQPDLLVTFGKSVIAKNLKLFLRKYRPEAHWHIQPSGLAADTFQSLSRVIHAEPAKVLSYLAGVRDADAFTGQKRENYRMLWKSRDEATSRALQAFAEEEHPFGEFEAVRKVMQHLPANSHLHLANSMPVRYANISGLLAERKDVQVYANRGTSGIDGCTGTAVGCALATDDPVVLLTGDMAFFYDRNSLWHNHLPANLKIVVLNNHGGGIFRLIQGPSSQPELEEYFETEQSLRAENTARDFDMEYYFCQDRKQFHTAISVFMTPSEKASILEVETSSATNEEIFKGYRNFIKGRQEAERQD